MDPDKWESLDSTADSGSGVMVSNLPLLFAHGLPTALHQMTVSELEVFVPFMVRCSVGEELTTLWSQLPRPTWWPSRLPFRVPSNSNSAKAMLTKLVERCYDFHGSIYLLQFCASLLQMHPAAGYRFTDNRDGTTSMYHGSTGKLLVTFRNENRDYDKTVTPKPTLSQKKLLPSSPNHLGHGGQSGSIMVRPPITDVYLCDKCDEEFSSLKEVQVHEKNCKGDRPMSPKMPSPEPELPEYDQDPEDQVPFLSYLGLKPSEHTGVPPYLSPRKRHQTPAKKANFTNYLRFDTIDVCSPMGNFILKHCKYGGKLQLSQHQVMKYERYVQALSDSDVISTRERSSNRWVVVWKRRDEPPWTHLYSFSQEDRKERLITIDAGLNKRSRDLLSKCQGIKVKLKRLDKRTIDRYKRKRAPVTNVPCIDLTTAEEMPLATPCSDPLSLTPTLRQASVFSPLQLVQVVQPKEELCSPPPLIGPMNPSFVPNSSSSSSSYLPSITLTELTPIQNGMLSIAPIFQPSDTLNPQFPHVNKSQSFQNYNLSSPLVPILPKPEKTVSSLRMVRNACKLSAPGQCLDTKPSKPTSKLQPGANVPSICTKVSSFSKTVSNPVENLSHKSKDSSKSIEVIDLLSDDEDDNVASSSKNSSLASFEANPLSGSYSRSKNGYSHWSSMGSFSLHGRSVRDLAANGMTHCSVPPSPTPSPSPTSSTSFVFPPEDSATWGEEKPNHGTSCRLHCSLKGITLDDEISFKSPLQVDEDISFTYQQDLSPLMEYQEPKIKLELHPENTLCTSNESDCCSDREFYSNFQGCANTNISHFNSLVQMPIESDCERYNAHSSQDSNSDKQVSKPKLSELKKLLGDECRELGRMGLNILRDLNVTSKQRITRYSLEKNNSLHTRRKCYVVPPRKISSCKPKQQMQSSQTKKREPTAKELPFLCPTHETFSTTKPVLQATAHSTCINRDCTLSKGKYKKLCVPNPELLMKENNNNNSSNNNNNSLNSYSTNNYSVTKEKETTSPSSPDKNAKNKSYKKRRRSLSKQRRIGGLSREISNLLRDECKEISDMGFHPAHILGATYNYYSDDNIDISYSPPKKKSLLSYSNKSPSPSKLDNAGFKDTHYTEDEDVEHLMCDNKQVGRELLNLMKDECKELRKSGQHPSQIHKLLSNMRNLRSAEAKESLTDEKSSIIPRRRLSLTINRDYSLTRSTRQQAKMLSCVQIETPRSAHRELIQKETGMCVVSYSLPIIC